MSKRLAMNMIAVLIAVLLLTLLLGIGGCTRYHVQRGTADCPECVEVSVWSNRSFEQPELNYNRSEHREGGNVGFTFGAANAQPVPSPLEQAAANLLWRLAERELQNADGN